MKSPIVLRYTHPGDARGWIALGCWMLVLAVLGMIIFERKLLDNDAFLILATAIVITGWVQGPVGWAYQATKGGGEAAESTARIAEEAATAAIKQAAPKKDPPEGVKQAADQVADAAAQEAEQIGTPARKGRK